MPIAAAARAAGHEVRFACGSRMAGFVRDRGFDVVAVPPHGRPPERLPLAEPDVEKELRLLRERFAGPMASERADALGDVLRDWGPDALVHDESDFGSPAAAARGGVPSAAVLIGAAATFFEAAGTPPPRVAISPFPPSFRHPDAAPVDLSIRLDDAPLAHGDTVYATLGTIFNLESGDLFVRLLAGLRGRRAILTVGHAVDPAELGPPPPGVRVERFVPMAEVLPRCCAVVSHGGSGSLLGALAHGLPSVLLPMGADQLHNAARAEELGVAVALHAVRATPEDIAAALDGLESCRAAAVRFHEEIAALPGPEAAVGLIERL